MGDDISESSFALLLAEMAERGDLDETLGEALAVAVEARPRRAMSEDFAGRMRAAVSESVFDGRVARGRAQMEGTLGGVASALRRIREASSSTISEMARRAHVEDAVWSDIELQRTRAENLGPAILASVLEAAQLRLPELADSIHRSRRLRVVRSERASFRGDESGDRMAAFDDLVEASEAPVSVEAVNEDRGEDRFDEDLRELVRAVERELRKRGREDLLEPV